MGHKEEVKFQLKTVAGEVANWDRYRWKIVHALDQHNKVVREPS